MSAKRAANVRPLDASLDRLSKWLLAAVLFCISATHAPLIGYKTFANVDEAYAFALGGRIVEGFKLYQGAISQRGPLMYYVFAVIAKMGGWDNIVCVRLWALAFAYLHVVLVWWIARRLGSPRTAIFATLISGYAMTIGLPGFDRFCLNGEYLQLPFLLLGVGLVGTALVSRPPRRSRTLRLFFGAVSLGLSVCVKQSIALHVAPVFVWILADAMRAGNVRLAVRDSAIVVVGLVLPALGFVAHASATGTLADMIFYCVTYNAQVHMGSSFGGSMTPASFEMRGNPMFGVISLLVGVVAGAGLWARVRGAAVARSLRPLVRAFSVRSFFLAQAAVGVLSAASLRRFYPHYFIPAIPLLALAAGLVLDRWSRSARATHGASFDVVIRWVGRVGIAAIFMLSTFETFALEKIDGMVEHDRTVLRISKYIEETTTKDAKIFVWGFSPWLYQYSHRRPAGRYVFSTYVTGLIPFRHEDPEIEKTRIIPGSQEALLGDLDREDPQIVVDAGAVLLARSMRAYEKPNAWLRAGYCFEVRVRGFDLYRRKPNKSEPCAQPKFPQVQGAYGLVGDRMPTAVPAAVDADRSYWLATVDEGSATWFPDGPTPPHVDILTVKMESAKGMRLDPAIAPTAPAAILH